MSSSRRSFFRDLAAAAARALPDPALPIEFGTEPPAPLLNDSEMERYSRQLLLPEWSELAQISLRDASVLVIGAMPSRAHSSTAGHGPSPASGFR